ncbi:MAG: 1-(5-phosphoribosyl)-5-[(5-phosphoribosylamino)methylideneamino]imidazole-4-carboxamide isomerase [Chloroflexi bacterium]|nr:1-(5-phosphoribosyl)-5-[(5-phosphoribosylamino)methylideneamino]imidazole-4-carboxamide isomerase [Chloroflexota bacterium]
MEVIPAIDIRGGRCVQLYQGDYGRETVFSDDPVEVASRWTALGAKRIHVVDLDGARAGAPVNLEVVSRIAKSAGVPVQVGGGIRNIETAKAVLAMGADRVMIGTAAVEDPEVARGLCSELGPHAVVISVDARGGYVAVKGWTDTSSVKAADLISDLSKVGARRFMYTDIARDGTLTEPNFPAIEALLSSDAEYLLAAGGISTLDHITRLAELGVEGAIVGTAIYTGDVDLRQAIEAVR